MAVKIRENHYLRKSRISEKSSEPNKNALARPFWANDPKSFVFERYELYMCDSSPKLGPFFHFRAPLLVQSQKFQISRYTIFPTGHLYGPQGHTQKIWAVVPILNWLPKSAKTAILKNQGFLRNPANRTKIALARPIFEQMTPNLLQLILCEKESLYISDMV